MKVCHHSIVELTSACLVSLPFSLLIRATDDFNTPLLVGIGAHYSERMVPRDDMLLHIVKEAEILAGRPYSVLYFHSNVTLGAKPQVG